VAVETLIWDWRCERVADVGERHSSTTSNAGGKLCVPAAAGISGSSENSVWRGNNGMAGNIARGIM